MRYNPPPNWPAPPPGWSPPPGWQPDPSWPPPPPGWQLWTPDGGRRRTWLIIGAIMAVVAIVAITVTVVLVKSSKPSDQEQIRSVVARMEEAYNRSDLKGFKTHLCKKDLQDRSFPDENEFGGKNDPDGRIDITVTSVEVTGAKAKANLDLKYEKGRRDTDNLPFVREDGKWKACDSEK